MLLYCKAENGQGIVIANDMAGKDAFDIGPVEIPEVWILRNIEVVIPVYEVISAGPHKARDGDSKYRSKR
jgi:hypothetical protein